MAKVKFDKDGEGGREDLGMGSCSINIWDGSDLEFNLIQKSSLYSENCFPVVLLSSIFNTSIFKTLDVF